MAKSLIHASQVTPKVVPMTAVTATQTATALSTRTADKMVVDSTAPPLAVSTRVQTARAAMLIVLAAWTMYRQTYAHSMRQPMRVMTNAPTGRSAIRLVMGVSLSVLISARFSMMADALICALRTQFAIQTAKGVCKLRVAATAPIFATDLIMIAMGVLTRPIRAAASPAAKASVDVMA